MPTRGNTSSGMGLLYKSKQKNPFTQDNIELATSSGMFDNSAMKKHDFSGKSFTDKYKSDFDTSSATGPKEFNNSLSSTINKTFSLATAGASALGSSFAKKTGGEGGVSDIKTSTEAGADSSTSDAGEDGKDGKGGGMGAAATGAAVQAAGVAANMIAGGMEEKAGIQADNLDKSVNQGKMGGAGALSGAAKGASMGMAFGPWGAAIGGVVGGAAGFFMGKKKGKEMEAERKRLVKKRNIGRMHEGQAKLANESNMLAQAAQSRYAMAEKGGKFYIATRTFTLSGKEGELKKLPRERFTSFRIGGKLNDTHNIIPNGVSHEEENSWGTKGQPVVKCKNNSCEKVYEIESEELIITKDTTDKLEELSKDGDIEGLGKYMTEQLLGNTFSYTDSFKEINNESI